MYIKKISQTRLQAIMCKTRSSFQKFNITMKNASSVYVNATIQKELNLLHTSCFTKFYTLPKMQLKLWLLEFMISKLVILYWNFDDKQCQLLNMSPQVYALHSIYQNKIKSKWTICYCHLKFSNSIENINFNSWPCART